VVEVTLLTNLALLLTVTVAAVPEKEAAVATVTVSGFTYTVFPPNPP